MLHQPGEILGEKYRIEHLLGTGAFGEVFLATHLKLHTLRALKILSHSKSGVGSTEYNDYFTRFTLEAQLGAQTNHAHVVQVYDFEQLGDELVLVMEYAPGGSLSDLMDTIASDKRELAVNDVVNITRDLAEGLAAIHIMDVVHRDLKPANILFDAEGHAKIADLGVAQVKGGSTSRSQLGPIAHSHPGTPAYMSPEQELTGMYLTPASDIYSLGIILFELLTGRTFKSLPPGTRVKSLRQDIPNWLDELITKMLSEKPSNRPWSGSELVDELKKHARIGSTGPVRIFESGKVVGKLEKRARIVQTIPAYSIEPRAIGSQRRVRRLPIWMMAISGVLALIVLIWLAVKALSPTLMTTPSPTSMAKVQQTSSIDGMVLVYVSAGSFQMGSNKGADTRASYAELPQHSVYLDGYWIDHTEVTNAMYARCVSTGSCIEPHGTSSWTRPDYYDNSLYLDFPVIQVDWNQASSYCQWAGRRLPTEAEWEKAARGNDGRIYPWGSQVPSCRLANYLSCFDDTNKVGSYTLGTSPYEALDMAGNVWEWVADWYSDTYYQQSPSSNPIGPSSGHDRVVRGGSWNFDEMYVRSAARGSETPVNKFGNLGFRCAVSP
jgi:eukaryotic-like serine/threonine-protein kinase